MKTLHPKIFGGVLADRNDCEHLCELVEQGIQPVEMVVCNFYPFEQQPSVEMIDIGGPSMVRAAAKNHENVVVLVSPSDYGIVLERTSSQWRCLPARRENFWLARLLKRPKTTTLLWPSG